MKDPTRYLPLIIVALLSILMSLAIHHASVDKSMHLFMNSTMGFFLCLLSMFKLFNLNGFADGFQMYDLLAQKTRIYAYCYPFLELFLGLCFLANLFPFAVNLLTLIIMLIAAIGVIKSVRAGMDLRCACLGTVLNVPLSTVSIVENLSMAIMAAMNLIRLW